MKPLLAIFSYATQPAQYLSKEAIMGFAAWFNGIISNPTKVS